MENSSLYRAVYKNWKSRCISLTFHNRHIKMDSKTTVFMVYICILGGLHHWACHSGGFHLQQIKATNAHLAFSAELFTNGSIVFVYPVFIRQYHPQLPPIIISKPTHMETMSFWTLNVARVVWIRFPAWQPQLGIAV